MKAREQGRSWTARQRKLRTHTDERRPACPATDGAHEYTTFEVHIAPRRVCIYCGHVAQPGEEHAGAPDGAGAR